MSSPRYIHLLADAATMADGIVPANPWDLFDHTWKQLATGDYIDPSQTLSNLAAAGLALLRHLTGTPVPQLAAQAIELHVGKNAGYAGGSPDPWANFRLASAFDVTPYRGVLVRLSDKFIRTINLRANPNNEQVGESLVDTISDAVGYALIARCIHEEDAA